MVRGNLRSGTLLGLNENFKLRTAFLRMSKFPRWSGLKHFHAVSTTEFSDGQSFYDILKVSDPAGVSTIIVKKCRPHLNQCILPCVVDLLPKNSSLVHCIRAYIHYRFLVGLRCMTDGQIKQLEKAILCYQECCAVRPHSPFTHVIFNRHAFNKEGPTRVWKELQLSKATCIPACYSRHQRQRNSGQLFYSYR